MASLPVVETHRQQVIDQPVRLIELGDSGTRSQASRALLVWGTAEQVPFLLRQLDTADNFAIDDVTAALGELGDARAVKPLVQLIRDSSGKRGGCAKVHDAGEALAKLGPIVEDEVLSLLIDEDEDVVDTACDVLRECGTSKSITPLTKLVRSASWKDSYKMSTERAISAIKRRGLHGVLSGPARKKRLAQSTHSGQS